jgi:hypothetical protein
MLASIIPAFHNAKSCGPRERSIPSIVARAVRRRKPRARQVPLSAVPHLGSPPPIAPAPKPCVISSATAFDKVRSTYRCTIPRLTLSGDQFDDSKVRFYYYFPHTVLPFHSFYTISSSPRKRPLRPLLRSLSSSSQICDLMFTNFIISILCEQRATEDHRKSWLLL